MVEVVGWLAGVFGKDRDGVESAVGGGGVSTVGTVVRNATVSGSSSSRVAGRDGALIPAAGSWRQQSSV